MLIILFRFLKIKGLKPAPKENPAKSFFHLAKPLDTATTVVAPPREEFSFLNKKNPVPEKNPNESWVQVNDQNLQPKNEIAHGEFFTQTQKNKSPQKIEPKKEKETIESHRLSPMRPKESPIKPPSNEIRPADTIVEKSVQKISPKPKEIQQIAQPEKPKTEDEKSPKPTIDVPSLFKAPTEKDPASTESKGKLFGFNTQNPMTFSGTSSNPPSGGLFLQNKPANPAGTGGLFQNLPSTNLFGASNPNLFQSKPTGTGIFGNNGTGPNLFGQNGTGTNLFGQPASQGGFFSSLLSQTPNSNTSIGLQNNNIKKDSDEEEGGSGDEDNPEPPSPEIDQSKSTHNFQYDEFSDKVCVKKVMKFKGGEKETYEIGTLSLEKIKDKDTYLVIYRNTAKLIMYRGWVVKKLTVTGTLNKRPDSLTLVLFTEDKDKKPCKSVCKIMFVSQKECEEFKQEVELAAK